jgi:hypothetical protein
VRCRLSSEEPRETRTRDLHSAWGKKKRAAACLSLRPPPSSAFLPSLSLYHHTPHTSLHSLAMPGLSPNGQPTASPLDHLTHLQVPTPQRTPSPGPSSAQPPSPAHSKLTSSNALQPTVRSLTVISGTPRPSSRARTLTGKRFLTCVSFSHSRAPLAS